ncbi:hypothetical protein [Pseudomonas sp. SDO55104_S430]
MRPKTPHHPKNPGSTDVNPPGRRETGPDILPGLPGHGLTDLPDLPLRPSLPDPSHPPETRPPTIDIIDLPDETPISRTTVEPPISHYYLPPKLVERLPAPDPQTGLRSIIQGRQYVDLVDGGTVLLASDPQGHWRAGQPSELVPSGPRLERVEGTLQWRQVQPGNTVTGPWKDWGIEARHYSAADITVDGVRYKTVPIDAAADHPIAYIKNPSHPIYGFDLFQDLLKRDPEQQPRGAIQVPSSGHWEIDPGLPFDRTLTDYVASYFPELSEISLLNVARRQFALANRSETATNAGLTTLRQVFNDWKTRNLSPRPELVDPLLMLPVIRTTAGKGTSRIFGLPTPTDQPLVHLAYTPHKFHRQWDYLLSTQHANELKRFMRELLIRNGYSVFEPTDAPSYAALVFRRTGHDFVFYMTLHRVHGRRMHIHESAKDAFVPESLPGLIGYPALRAAQDAEAAGKLIWLKGGSHISADHESSVFIVRTEDPRL